MLLIHILILFKINADNYKLINEYIIYFNSGINY